MNDNYVWLATSRPYVRFDELLIGVLAYILGRKTSAAASKPLLLVGGAILFGAYQLMSRPVWSEQIALIVDWVYMPAVLSVGFACVLVGSIKAKFQHPLVTFVANLSYSLYLMHAMLTLIVGSQPHEESFALTFLIGSLSMAYLASLLVEYPFLKMYKKPVPTATAKPSRSIRPIEMVATLSRAASSGGR